MSGTDAVAMSGAVAVAGFEGTDFGSDLAGVPVVNILSAACAAHAGSPHPTDLTMTDFWQEQETQIIIRIGLALRLRLGNPGLIGMGFHNG